MKLIALLIFLAALIPARATAGGVAVNVHALVLIVLLAAAAGGLAFAFRGGIAWRWSSWPTAS